MKAVITDEHDDYATVIEGPDEIIKRLREYLIEFDKYGHPAGWGPEDFVDFLNAIILKDSDEKVIILDLWTNGYDKNLPKLRI